ncbi:diaminopimelate decarboxylase [Actinokineospora alba]|uniref:Diaminopimelate decarboxylase n=1 Tax=Actinokineospora alba TaxID=504798 RepID=A0A1H0HRR2_9PSEU|nr:type III PLP-dependent enzyme [Actinokineospora alba]TDP64776.1 diaminopimelate decarboxylase [Actinokineospora alba]SDH45720.1 diaminopimelate decarboxylase [Actinokineospora alba]SDO21813.1 diaminopimelate decarboxylase [Actinokineospora alba]
MTSVLPAAVLAPAGTPLTDRVAEAVRELDGSPTYVYDLAHLDAHVTAIRAALGSVELIHAVKANPDPGLLRVIARHVDGLEVASGGELAHVLQVAPDIPLAFGGPGKTDTELTAALNARVDRFHVESLNELRRLDVLARDLGTRARVLLRVNLPTGGAPGVLTMGGRPSPFGMDPAEADACAGALESLPGIDFVGVHAHLASGLDPEPCAAQGVAIHRWAVDFACRHGLPLAEVNIGGGMNVDYLRPERVFDWADYARQLPVLPGGPVVRIEPGRAVSAYSGWYATEVLDVKQSHGEWFAICAGGTHHLRTPAAKGHDQPLAVLPVDRWDRPWARSGTDNPVTFVGQLCTPKDVLARSVRASRVRVGDKVVFALAGAYAQNISHVEFLMHDRPAVTHVGGR